MALINERVDPEVAAALNALGPYLPELVVIGGCASALYRHHAAASPGLAHIGTTDIDVACLVPTATGPRPPIGELLGGAGFLPEYHTGDQMPPIMKFRSTRDQNVDIELLAPLVGAPRRRDGTAKVTDSVQQGASAQLLRYLDLLLFRPCEVAAADIAELQMSQSSAVLRIPNPVAFVMQKILIMGEGRAPKDIDKDCHYIYDVAVTFRAAASQLAAWGAALKAESSTWRKWYERFTTVAQDRVFASASARGPVAAARVHRDAGIVPPASADEICRVVRRWLRLLP